MILPPLELELDHLGRRVVPLQSLLYVLECAMEQDGAGLRELHEAAQAALDAPLPGLTPMRGDQLPEGIPGMELAEPVEDPTFGKVHPGAA